MVSAAIPILTPHAPRIRSIHVMKSYGFQSDLVAIRPLFRVPLPSLRILRLMATRGVLSRNDGKSVDLGLATALQCHPHEFVTCNIILPPSRSPFWSELRVLQLDHHTYGGIPMSAADVLAILQSAPLLESLTVGPYLLNYLFMYPNIPGAIANQAPLTLLHLRHLTVIACYEFACPLLQRIGAPHLQSLHIDLRVSHEDPRALPHLLPQMLHPTHQQFLRRLSAIRVHPSFHYSDLEDGLLKTERFDLRDAGNAPNRAQDAFSLGVLREDPQPPWITSYALRTLGRFFSGVPLQRVDLVEHTNHSGTADDLLGLFSSLPSINALAMSDCASPVVHAVLDTLKTIPSGGGANLKTIETAHARFELPHEYEDIVEHLVAVARARAEAGQPLDCVSVAVPHRDTPGADSRLLKLLAANYANRVLLKDRYHPDNEPLVFSKEGEAPGDFELDAEIECYLASATEQ
ncbi:hypothetical protein C8Q76DRAFT_692489 [Earliella scabrosa]|nr:hypothetical protein C8Q76DRAFT_692489 [Earliella scabrosa]